MRNKDKILKITYGLPGSGKTSYSRKLYDDNRDYGRSSWNILDSDNIFYNERFNKSMKDRIKLFVSSVKSYSNDSDNRNLIIDGLFTTNDSLIAMLNTIGTIILKKFDKIIIVEFNEDRDACLWNDIGREKDATISIKNMDYESVDLDNLISNFKDFNFEIEKKVVERKNIIKRYLDDRNAILDYIESDTYTTGGNWRDCWGGGGEFDTESRSDADFYVLKELLKKLKIDDIDSVYYSIIEDDSLICVEEGSESDYYGGCKYYEYMRIYVSNLETWLKDKGYMREAILSELLD